MNGKPKHKGHKGGDFVLYGILQKEDGMDFRNLVFQVYLPILVVYLGVLWSPRNTSKNIFVEGGLIISMCKALDLNLGIRLLKNSSIKAFLTSFLSTNRLQ